MIYLLPFAVSLILGFCIVKTALKEHTPNALLTFFLSALIGLGTSGFLTFTSFVFFNQLVPFWVITLHLGVIAVLGGQLHRKGQLDTTPLIKTLSWQDGIAMLILIAICIPTIVHASLYPYGGWDAWGTWNMKARFLFLGGTSWSNMFDPMLWRDQINYPFLLPLIHVWFWSFAVAPSYIVPLSMTCLITFITAGLLYGILKEITGKSWLILVPACLFTNFSVAIQASSQYSDLLLAAFLLSALGSFSLFNITKEAGYLLLMGAALGMMGFTKVEGMSLLIITSISAGILITTTAAFQNIQKLALTKLGTAAALAAIPLLVFAFIYAPKEVAVFENGLISANHPSTLDRLRVILSYIGSNLVNARWQGLWLIPLIGVIITGKKSLHKNIVLFPVVLGTYTLIFLSMYFINTHYEIVWWLNTSFERVAMGILPATLCWATLAIFEK